MSLVDDLLKGLVSSSEIASELAKPEADLRTALDATAKAVAAWRQVLASIEPMLVKYGVKLEATK